MVLIVWDTVRAASLSLYGYPRNTTPDLLREIRRFADDKALGISAHVAESHSVVECVQREHGKGGVVEFLHQFGIPAANSVFAHSVHVSPAEIATVLHLSVGTVRNYLTNIVTKMNARNRVDAIRAAREAGWLP